VWLSSANVQEVLVVWATYLPQGQSGDGATWGLGGFLMPITFIWILSFFLNSGFLTNFSHTAIDFLKTDRSNKASTVSRQRFMEIEYGVQTLKPKRSRREELAVWIKEKIKD
jgi:hypothetical protein